MSMKGGEIKFRNFLPRESISCGKLASILSPQNRRLVPNLQEYKFEETVRSPSIMLFYGTLTLKESA